MKLDAVQALLLRLEAALTPDPPPPSEWHIWDPLPLYDFLDGMEAVREALGEGQHRFLDVGSGIGSKLRLANAFGFDAEGLERHAPYAEVSRALHPDYAVTRADALEFDQYQRFDVVYCAQIAVDADLQDEVNRHIATRMREGAVYFFVGEPLPDLERVAGSVWRV